MVLFFIKYDAMKMCRGMLVRLYHFLIYYKTMSSQLHTLSTLPPVTLGERESLPCLRLSSESPAYIQSL